MSLLTFVGRDKGEPVVLAGVITGTIKFLILFGVLLGIGIAFAVFKLLGGRK